MICVQLNGGLGNQMFQYACGKALALKYKTELLLDTTLLINNSTAITHRSFELDIFNFYIEEASKDELRRLKPLFYRIVNFLAFKIGFRGIQTSKYFVEKRFSFNSTIKKIGKNCFISGYWQSYRYFQHIEPIIREEFQFKYVLDNKNVERINLIKNENSVSIHLRRSDFVNNKSHNIHGTCSIDYYKKAIEYIIDRVYAPLFIVFSDDLEWAQTNLNLKYPCKFMSGNNGDKSFIDMQLMSLCKHNIIANSSFSWWGGWLNLNTDKIVIAPKQWFSDENMNAQTNDLIPKTWIRL